MANRALLSLHFKWLASLVAVLLAQLPGQAWACGGCVGPQLPPASPQVVRQASERILFVRSLQGDAITVHIEIRYTGLAKDFGWVLPVTKVPKVSVSSDLIFRTLDSITEPRFRVVPGVQQENCRDPWIGCQASAGCSTCADVTADDTSASTDASVGFDVMPPPEVEVLASGQTGPFDYLVLDAKDAAPLVQWLNQTGYALPPSAVPIVDSHLAKGDVFVAIKLQSGQGIEAIRPLRLDMPTDEACVPLRMTSIAAEPNMDVQAFLIGPGRAIPKNMLHVRPNPLHFAWPQFGFAGGPNNYEQVLSAAMDEADGAAFVTEYASAGSSVGSLTSLRQGQLDDAAKVHSLGTLAKWLDNARLTVSDSSLLSVLTAVGLPEQTSTTAPELLTSLLSCSGSWRADKQVTSCLQGLLGGTEEKWAAVKVDGKALTEAVDTEWWLPVVQAEAVLQGMDAKGASQWLTRLRVLLDAEEMDRDPLFAFNKALPAVQTRYDISRGSVCPGGWLPTTHHRWSINGMGSWVTSGQLNQDPRLANMPFALAIELLDEAGPPQIVAPSQAGVLAQAVAAAVPGKAQLPPGFVVVPGTAWVPPASDSQYTSAGPWPRPSGCKPKPGWKDGQPPPVGQGTLADAESLDVSGVDSWTEPPVFAPSPAPKSDGCSSGRGASGGAASAAFALAAGLLAVFIRRRGATGGLQDQ